MRVLLLTTSFPISKTSSSGIFVGRLAGKLAKQCSLTVLAPDINTEYFAGELPHKLILFRYAPRNLQVLAHNAGGIPAMLKSRPYFWMLIPFFLFFMGIQSWRYGRKSDVIFANWSICGVVAGIAGKFSGTPVITALRGTDANKAKTSFVYRYLLKACLRLSQYVVGVSEDIALQAKQLFPESQDKLLMIPNGVDIPAKPYQRTEHETIKLVVVGSLIQTKSVETLLYALPKLPENITVSLVGDGPERKNLQQLAIDLNITERISFVGQIPPDQVSDWLYTSDILVMCSKHEGRPNVVLEAMSASLPVVGTDIPGLRELVLPGESGFLFPVGDSEALAACLLKLIDGQLRNSLGNRGYNLLHERALTWENTANSYIQLFKQVITKDT